MDTQALITERGKTHGNYAHHAEFTRKIKDAMYNGCDEHSGWNYLNAMQEEALDMIAHKIGRILAGDPDFRDHWDDIAGYAKLVADRCTK